MRAVVRENVPGGLHEHLAGGWAGPSAGDPVGASRVPCAVRAPWRVWGPDVRGLLPRRYLTRMLVVWVVPSLTVTFRFHVPFLSPVVDRM